MNDPRRSEPAAAPADVPERDRDARVEELLLSGLDHYFHGRHELAINIWTRVLFLDRGHARARAYIERARSAVAERQREGDELMHAGAAAFQRGDVEGTRRLLTAALERGVASDDALALLERLHRLETAALPADTPPRRPAEPLVGSQAGDTGRAAWGRARLVWVTAGALLGASGLALLLWAGGEARGVQVPDTPAPGWGLEAPLPVPGPAEIALTRARSLYDKGRLREALPLLESVPQGDPLRPQADDLRATIQRRLLETRPRNPGASAGGTR